MSIIYPLVKNNPFDLENGDHWASCIQPCQYQTRSGRLWSFFSLIQASIASDTREEDKICIRFGSRRSFAPRPVDDDYFLTEDASSELSLRLNVLRSPPRVADYGLEYGKYSASIRSQENVRVERVHRTPIH